MSIQEFMNTYVKNINDAEMLKIVNSVGIKMSTLQKNYMLSDIEVSRLRNNSKINVHIVNREIIKRHEGMLEDYDKMIAHYNELLKHNSKDPSKDKILPEDRAGIEEIRDRLVSERGEYKAFVDKLNHTNGLKDSSSLTSNIDGKSLIKNPVIQARVDINQWRLDKKSDKMNEKYAELDEIREKMNSAKSSYMRAKYAKKEKQLVSKIRNLRNKSGKIQRKQRQLIGKGVKRYRKKFASRISLAASEFERETKYIEERTELTKSPKVIAHDLADANNELSSIALSGKLADVFRRAELRHDIRTMERIKNNVPKRLEKLQKENGRYRATASVGRTINRAVVR